MCTCVVPWDERGEFIWLKGESPAKPATKPPAKPASLLRPKRKKAVAANG
jgi:hypothetical protein